MTPTDNLFWPYLSPILEEEKTKNDVTYIAMSDGNGMDRMIEDSRSEDVYPGIFVLRPKYSGKEVDGALLLAQFDAIFYVFCQGLPDDRASQDAAYQQAETIVSSIIQRLQHDRRTYQNYLEFDSVRIEPVVYMTSVDATYGYEVKFKMGLAANGVFC